MERIAFGKVLQGLRKTKGITQEQLSEMLGVSAAAVSKWENEQMYPDISYFPVLARFFNVSIDCLFGFSNELSEQEYQNKLSECHPTYNFPKHSFMELTERKDPFYNKYRGC